MTGSLHWVYAVLISTIIFNGGNAFAQSFKSESELRKQAEKDFKNEDYAAALPLYSQLLSLNQKDAKLNYRYGVCLLMADKDKTSAYNYLEFASRDAKMEDDVYFYIGRALQLKYRFDEAINAYREFMKRAGSGAAKKLDTEWQIETCNHAKELMKTRTNTVVKSSKEVSANAIYGAYDFAAPGGKLLATSATFMTALDKKRNLTPMMFLSADGQTIYYSSYGKNEDNGKDIYVVRRSEIGWGQPVNLGKVVNTNRDEDYPYLDADGKTLYFSSKGHNSMGGYDLFKTTYNVNTGEWSEPENMGAGINSPDDDFFYMPTADGEAQFASTKETVKGMVMIYSIEVASSQKVLATVHGKYKSKDQPRADGKISVLRKSDNALVATSRTDARTGQYDLSLPMGDDYEIVVEGGGYMAHVEDFSLPKMDHSVTIDQQVTMNRNKDVEDLEIRNQYLQSDSASTASAAQMRDSGIAQVIKNEYQVDALNAQKLQPFNVDGQVVYATPPLRHVDDAANAQAANSADATGNHNSTAADGNVASNANPVGMNNSVSPNTQQDNKASPNAETKNVDNTSKKNNADVGADVSNVAGTSNPNTANHVAQQNAKDEIPVTQDVANNTSDEKGKPVEVKSSNTEKQETAIADKQKDNANGKVAGSPTAVPSSDSNTTSADKKPITSDDEAVAIAFNDAKDLDQEAKETFAEAKTASVQASTKDSISRQQLDQMTELLQKGDEAGAREISRQSQLNADSAQQERALSHDLNEKAKAEQVEANKALADAKQLQKNTARNNQVALNKSKGERKKEIGNDEGNADDKATASDAKVESGEIKNANQATASNDVKSNGVQNGVPSASHNAPVEVETNNHQSTDSTINKPDALNSQSIKTDKQTAEGEKKDLVTGTVHSDSANAAENKSNITAAKPATSEEATQLADKLKTESKDLKLQAEALKDQIKKSDDKEQNKEWLKQANEFEAESKEKGKEADKELAVAKELKKKEDKNPVQAVASNAGDRSQQENSETAVDKQVTKNDEKNVAPVKEAAAVTRDNKKEAQPLADNAAEVKKDDKKENPAVTIASNKSSPDNNVSTDQPSSETKAATSSENNKQNTPAVNEQKTAKANPVVAQPGEESFSSQLTKESGNNKATEANPPVQVEEKRTVASNGTAGTSEQSIEIPKNVSLEAGASYKEYIKTKQESDAQAKQSDDLQDQIAKMAPSPERDQLIQKSNDLSLQSIKTWQQAQVELNKAKEIDPSVESKMKNVHFADVNPEVKKDAGAKNTGAANPNLASNNSKEDRPLTAEELNKARQKDSLINEAVSHRFIAENTSDSVTEKTELQKTKQLIVESENPALSGKREDGSGKQTASKSAASQASSDKQKPENKATGINSNDESKKVINNVDNPSKKPASQSGSLAENSATKEQSSKSENAAKTENIAEKNKSVQNETALKAASKETTTHGAAPITAESGNSASPVLEAKTMNVDESSIFSTSPKVYNAANPVPMDPALPEGLVFKVQIGAFRNPLPPEKFNNVQPLSGETTRPGWIRYCVGMFRTFEPANMVKAEMRSRGYKDAFVVVYYNGKRISLADAYAIINRSGTNEKTLYADASAKETNHLNSLNIKSTDLSPSNDADAASFYGTPETGTVKEESAVEYAVQVGVYKSNVVPKPLRSLIPLNAESYKSNLYKFTTRHFSQRTSADSMKLVAINAGVKDAFVVIYKGSNKGGENNASGIASKASNASATANASTENQKIIYKVQIVAYRSDPSQEKLAALKAQCNAELTQSVSTTGMHFVYAGSFNDYAAATVLKNAIVNKGIKDAFIVSFAGDTKIPVQKAVK